MARGKYKHRKGNRDLDTLQSEIAELTAQISQARQHLAAAQTHSAERRELEVLLQQHLAERDSAAAPELERLTRDSAVLAEVLEQSKTADKPLHSAYLTYVHRYINQRGETNLEAIEELIGGVIAFNSGPGRRKLDTEAIIRLDIARGERRHDYTTPTAASGMERAYTLAPPALRKPWQDWLAAKDATDDEFAPTAPSAVRELLTKWRRATAASLSPDVALAGHPHPCVDTSIDPHHPVAALLGLTLAGPDPSPRQAPPEINQLLSDRAFDALQDPWSAVYRLVPRWRVNRDTVGDPARIPTPVHNLPRHPSPADAVATLHWYSLAAAGAWARNADSPVGAAYGEAAVGLAAATTYWMPAGQVSGYLDSEPIPAEDRKRIRLSFPNIYLALGQPIVLPALPSHLAAVDTEPLENMSEDLVRAKPGASVSWLLARADGNTRIGLLDLIATKGARIEGVLLLGDHDGDPSGHIAWCIAVPGRVGVLGRWVLPAHRDKTFYANQVDALLAVAAWADWHSPADPETATSTHRRSAALQRAAAAGRVHVLNAARTASAARPSTPTGRTVSAHIRRGHWRRQHFGPGRSQTRMVRIAPAIVGSGTVRRSALVYRLPTPTT